MGWPRPTRDWNDPKYWGWKKWREVAQSDIIHLTRTEKDHLQRITWLEDKVRALRADLENQGTRISVIDGYDLERRVSAAGRELGVIQATISAMATETAASIQNLVAIVKFQSSEIQALQKAAKKKGRR